MSLFSHSFERRRDAELIREIRETARGLRGLTDSQLTLAAESLRETLDHEPFRESGPLWETGGAVALEALRRTLGWELFDVQLQAGIALCRGAIVEMQTGEGKTLAGFLPAVWHGLAGHSVHVATSNGYLATRDCEQLQPAFELLGLATATIEGTLTPEQKRTAYQADVVYGPGHEFGFDYLRDRLAVEGNAQPLGLDFLSRLSGAPPRRVQRMLHVAVIDEADQVLLDDAISPLVISGGGTEPAADAEIYRLARTVADGLVEGVDYLLFPSRVDAKLTESGLRRIHQQFYQDQGGSRSVLLRPWSTYVENALRAAYVFIRDVHYVIVNGELRIVDESTGRIFEDRSWQSGLHQAVEAATGITITAEKQPLAQISRQSLFRKYRQLSGMTGTATGSEREFRQTYRVPIVNIPPRLPSQRKIFPTLFFPNRDAKRDAIVREIDEQRCLGRPVLIGTRSIVESVELSSALQSRRIVHQLLNGRQDAEEAAIIAAAGAVGCVTIATNLAGRGTDIRLSDASRKCGGLHVIAAEPYESSRVDRQLIGRSARQGDPGSARIFVSPDDTLFLRHAPWLAAHLRTQATTATGTISRSCDRLVARLQQDLEHQSAASRTGRESGAGLK